MPRYERLSVDVDMEPWRPVGAGLDRALEAGLDALSPPLHLEVDGLAAGELMTFRRGFRLEATTDVLAGPALAAILEDATLPEHEAMECLVELVPYDLRTMRVRERRPAPAPYRWWVWRETFARRLDLSRSTFHLRYPDGTRAEARYEELEDLQQVQRRSATRLELDIAPDVLEWSDERVYALDVIPLQADLFLSPALAERIRAAELPGVRVLPPREAATLF